MLHGKVECPSNAVHKIRTEIVTSTQCHLFQIGLIMTCFHVIMYKLS